MSILEQDYLENLSTDVRMRVTEDVELENLIQMEFLLNKFF